MTYEQAWKELAAGIDEWRSPFPYDATLTWVKAQMRALNPQELSVLTETLGSLEAAIRSLAEALASQGKPQAVKEPPATPDPGEGYRWLEEDREMLQEGDEYKNGTMWFPIEEAGLLVKIKHRYRRKIEPRRPQVGDKVVIEGVVVEDDGDHYRPFKVKSRDGVTWYDVARSTVVGGSLIPASMTRVTTDESPV